MNGISSKAAGDIQNKKKFNGYEFNNDFDINLYESFYRTNDPQIGRFWQIDPKPDERISLYSSMGNNPISLNDLLGDTTHYYNSEGKSIGEINRGSGVTAVEVGDGWSNLVGLAVNAINANKDLTEKEVGAFDALLQGTGTAYDVSSFSKFFDDNNKSTPASTVDGESTKKWTNITLNGKPSKLYAEIEGNIVLKNGRLTVGKGKHTRGDMVKDYPSDLPYEQDKKSYIHLHTISEITTLSYSYPSAMGDNKSKGYGYFGAGPSQKNGDQTKAAQNMRDYGVRTVVVDARNIYLINGVGNDKDGYQTITIPR